MRRDELRSHYVAVPGQVVLRKRLNPRMVAALFDVPVRLIIPRYWPPALCWLFGHLPTEPDDFARNTLRCRCCTVRDVYAERVDRVPAWWRRLVDRLP